MQGEAWADETVRDANPHRARFGAIALSAVMLTPAVASCGADDDAVLVLAAASLTDVLTQMEADFESANPGVDVQVSFAGTNAVQVQIEQGAPADVVAFADTAPMDDLVADGDVRRDDVNVFAQNRIVLATPTDDPGDVASLADLADPGRTIGLCATAVPCGALAAELLDRAGVDASPDTEEPDVRSLVAKLVSGELDAGLIYATDATAFGDELRVVPDLGVDDVTNTYTVAVIADSERRGPAGRFVAFVLSDAGSEILLRAGFDLP